MRWCSLVGLAVFAVVQLAGCGSDEAASFAAAQQALWAGACTVEGVTVRDFGKVVYVGDVDLLSEVKRIVRGDHLPFKHDGTVFKNREHRLPEHSAGYYHEFVHPTPGVRGPGPQRLVLGDGREVEYTPDHYASFTLLPELCLQQAGGF